MTGHSKFPCHSSDVSVWTRSNKRFSFPNYYAINFHPFGRSYYHRRQRQIEQAFEIDREVIAPVPNRVPPPLPRSIFRYQDDIDVARERAGINSRAKKERRLEVGNRFRHRGLQPGGYRVNATPLRFM